MDYNPRRILHMLRLGLGERVLQSQAIWLCTSCYSCTVRCPREIKISDAMLGLRSLAVEQGLVLHLQQATILQRICDLEHKALTCRGFKQVVLIALARQRRRFSADPIQLLGQANDLLLVKIRCMLQKGHD